VNEQRKKDNYKKILRISKKMSHGYLILLVDALQVIIGGKLDQTLVLPGLNKGKQVREIIFSNRHSAHGTPPPTRGTWH
jgi:hypothetical protein